MDSFECDWCIHVFLRLWFSFWNSSADATKLYGSSFRNFSHFMNGACVVGQWEWIEWLCWFYFLFCSPSIPIRFPFMIGNKNRWELNISVLVLIEFRYTAFSISFIQSGWGVFTPNYRHEWFNWFRFFFLSATAFQLRSTVYVRWHSSQINRLNFERFNFYQTNGPFRSYFIHELNCWNSTM